MQISNTTKLLEEALFAMDEIRKTIGEHNNKILEDELDTIDLALNSVMVHSLDIDMLNNALRGSFKERLDGLESLHANTSFGRRCMEFDPADRCED